LAFCLWDCSDRVSENPRFPQEISLAATASATIFFRKSNADSIFDNNSDNNAANSLFTLTTLLTTFDHLPLNLANPASEN